MHDTSEDFTSVEELAYYAAEYTEAERNLADTCAGCEASLPPDHQHCLNEPCSTCLCPACFAAHNGICQDCYDDMIAEE